MQRAVCIALHSQAADGQQAGPLSVVAHVRTRAPPLPCPWPAPPPWPPPARRRRRGSGGTPTPLAARACRGRTRRWGGRWACPSPGPACSGGGRGTSQAVDAAAPSFIVCRHSGQAQALPDSGCRAGGGCRLRRGSKRARRAGRSPLGAGAEYTALRRSHGSSRGWVCVWVRRFEACGDAEGAVDSGECVGGGRGAEETVAAKPARRDAACKCVQNGGPLAGPGSGCGSLAPSFQPSEVQKSRN